MWTVEFLDRKVLKEFLALPADLQASYTRIADLIAQEGLPDIGMPLVKSLGNRLWEIRMHGRSGIARALYVVAVQKRVVVVHVFVKKTQATPHQAIALAQKRMKEAGL